jgi:NAD(P)-dependent dehydrogenase (short-subunit alcohol dehydrogenase family)
MPGIVEGKVAIVTGAGRGIGRAIALLMAEEGAKVVVNDVGAALDGSGGDIGPAQEVVNEIKKKGGQAIASTLSVGEPQNADQIVKAAIDAFGRVDIMVNNAGSAAGGVIEHLTEDDWEKGLQLKFMGYVRCLRYVLPLMVKQGGGRVVNLIGNDGVKPSYWEICPGAANAAGQNLTLSLAGQYGKHGISFCAVNPGPVRTERWTGLVKAMSRDMNISYEEADTLAPSSIPMGRIAEVEAVANLVVMLASPLMEMVNGTMIEIDGGQDKPLMDRFRDKNRS